MRRMSAILIFLLSFTTITPSFASIPYSAYLEKLAEYKTALKNNITQFSKCIKGDSDCNPQKIKIARLVLAITTALAIVAISGSIYVVTKKRAPSIAVAPHVSQVIVPRQIGNTCGFWSIDNALCLANTVGKGPIGPISKQPIKFTSSTQTAYEQGQKGEWRELVEKLRADLGINPGEVAMLTDMLESDEIVALIKHLRPEHEFVIFSPEVSDPELYDAMIKNRDGLQQKIEEFTQSDTQTLPIIVQIKIPQGPHWVVDVLHKGPDGTIYHTLADSYNSNLRINPIIQEIIAMTQ